MTTGQAETGRREEYRPNKKSECSVQSQAFSVQSQESRVKSQKGKKLIVDSKFLPSIESVSPESMGCT